MTKCTRIIISVIYYVMQQHLFLFWVVALASYQMSTFLWRIHMLSISIQHMMEIGLKMNQGKNVLFVLTFFPSKLFCYVLNSCIVQITLSFYSSNAQMCSDCQLNSGNQCCRSSDDGIDPNNRNAKLCNSVNEFFKRIKDII